VYAIRVEIKCNSHYTLVDQHIISKYCGCTSDVWSLDRMGAWRTGVAYMIEFWTRLQGNWSRKSRLWEVCVCVYVQKFEIGLNLQYLKNGMGSSRVHGVDYLNEQFSSLEMNQWMRNSRFDFVSILLQSQCKIIYIYIYICMHTHTRRLVTGWSAEGSEFESR
jgi:hypothetical protein